MLIDDYEEIYSFKVDGLTEEQHVMGDIPHEYRVVKLETVTSGVMVWGRYRNRWYPNPSCRYLVAHLLYAKSNQSIQRTENKKHCPFLACEFADKCLVPCDWVTSR